MPGKIKQDMSIGGNLGMLRERQKLSQEQVAAKLQVMGFPISRAIISRMERGQYNIRVSELLAMKAIYHVGSFDDFFAGLELSDKP